MVLIQVGYLNTFGDTNSRICGEECVAAGTEKLKRIVHGKRSYSEPRNINLRRLDPVRLQ